MNLVFLDTETTSLDPGRRAWDIAAILRRPGQPDYEYTAMVDATDLDLGRANPFSLQVGQFYERHPYYQAPVRDGDQPLTTVPEWVVLTHLEHMTRGTRLVGIVPDFDAYTLGPRMRAHGILPSWHYHKIDVLSISIGYLAARGSLKPVSEWTSAKLAEEVNVPEPMSDRHTAIGDARWARDIFDKIVKGQLE